MRRKRKVSVRRAVVALLAWATLLAPAVAWAGEPTRLELGWRVGIAVPAGDAIGAPPLWRSVPMDSVVHTALPVWLDAGFRFGGRVLVGAAFEYARAVPSPRLGCPPPLPSCSAEDVFAGAQLQYRVPTRLGLEPWAGIAIGYEGLGIRDALQGGRFDGVAVPLQIGADYRAAPGIAIGAFGMLTGGTFLGCSSAFGGTCSIAQVGLHEWVTFGVKATFAMRVGP
jgi:hypothetical protein